MDLPPDSLPPTVVDTYKEYKWRQKILVNWLQQQSQLFADRGTPSRGVQDRKLFLSDIEKLTLEVVARQVKISDDVLYAAQTMLRMRKEVGAYYKNSADEGHEWCIVRFEQIVSSLSRLPRMTKSPERQKPALITPEASPEGRNRFESLPAVEMSGLGPNYDAFQKLGIASQESPERSRKRPKLVESNTEIEVEVMTAEMVREGMFRSPLYLLRVATRHAFKVCAKAGQGQLPLPVAAYITERACLSNLATWMDMIHPLYPNVDGINLSAFVQTMFQLFNEGMNKDYMDKYSCHDFKTEFSEPCEVFDSVLASCDVKQERAAMLSGARRVATAYKQTLISSMNRSQVDNYYTEVLKHLMLEDHICKSMDRRKLVLSSANRLTELAAVMSPTAKLEHRAFWAHGMYLLRRTAQCFEYGFSEAEHAPQKQISPPPNCRLKALSFAQELSKAISQYMPEPEPENVGYSTWHNLVDLELGVLAFLADKRFDSVTQHPLFAGTDILMILDHAYRLGFQLLAFGNVFLGPLHVYNALYQLGVLEKEITILETFCEKFREPAFYGTRPSKKFLQCWRYLNDFFNTSQNSRREAKINMFIQHSTPLKLDAEFSDGLVRTERRQWMYEDSVQGYNKRFRAEEHSFFHKIFNQKNDIQDYVNTDTIEHLLGKDAVDDPVTYVKRAASSSKLCSSQLKNQAAAETKGEGHSSGIELALTALEDALVEEFSGCFPLISANLMKLWYHCHSLFSKIVVKQRSSLMLGGASCLREVLAECDEIVAELRQCGADNAAREAVLGMENLKKYKPVRRWKRAFVKEFDGLSLEDFQWKNL